jgi:hypothetical protein
VIRVSSPYGGRPVAHLVATYPGGHANTALCGAPIVGRLRVIKNPTCASCARAWREGVTS